MLLLLVPWLAVVAAPSSLEGAGAPGEEPAAAARRALESASRGEPSISDLQAAAARCSDPLGAGASADRGRIAALLPRLTAELRIDERSYRVMGLQGTGEVDYARYAPGWLAAVRASWDLSSLVHPPAELLAAKGALERARRRAEAIRKVTVLYFERRRLRLALALSPPPSAAERAEAELELERLAAELDGLTGGAFTGSAR
jgi:hypothetical protein